MPRRSRRINPAATSQRTALRAVGGVLAIIGGVLIAVGMVSFFSAFGGDGRPEKFWCLFVGLPILGVGAKLLQAGYLGAAARYVAGETAPVASDTLNYMADETAPGVRKMASAIAGGIRDAERGGAAEADAAGAAVACPACGHENDPDARFCDQCGAGMPAPRDCPACGKQNDADARFCDGCGAALT